MTEPQESVLRTVIHNILEREGGIADVGDGAGITRYGQTPGWLAQWRLPVPQSADDAAMNYRSWIEQTNLDVLCTEDDALPDAVIDWAVNAGERVAIASLQRALGVVADGVIGPKTTAAIARCDRPHIAAHVVANRLVFTMGLVAEHPEKHLKFLRNWTNRLAEQVRSLA